MWLFQCKIDDKFTRTDVNFQYFLIKKTFIFTVCTEAPLALALLL